ncbi:MAG: type II toxin-antitoxin system MqsA family antitoxin [Fluviibacter phosphoraccumulans]
MNNNVNQKAELCPVCGEDVLQVVNGSMPFEYQGQTTALEQLSSTCDCCGSEIATAAQSKANLRAATAFKKQVDGFLAGAEIRDFRKRFDLTQEVCALLFGGGEVAFSRYESDTVYQSAPMDRLIRLCIHDPKNILELSKQSAVELSKETRHQIQMEADKRFMSVVQEAFFAFAPKSPQSSKGASANEDVFERYAAGDMVPAVSKFVPAEVIGAAA